MTAASPAGPVDERPTPLPPGPPGGRLVQTLRFGARPLSFALRAQREHGDVFTLRLLSRKEPLVLTAHPDHVKSLFTAKPEVVPSITAESPLRPILGPNSVLTANGERHLRQRKLLLPPFHGEAVQRYVAIIEDAIDREISRWEAGREFALAPRMQAVTLDVIMAGIFGIEGRPAPGTPEFRLRRDLRRLVRMSTNPGYQLVELANYSSREPRGVLKALLAVIDRRFFEVIERRRRAPLGDDVMSLLLATDLSDREVRDELLTLVLAGHETTANSLAWTVERLLRAPAAYERLRESARAGDEDYVEATVYEGMRVRPVIQFVGRVVQQPWRLGEHVVAAGSAVGISIVGVHHREDVYPQPHAFRPERFLDAKAGTYTWIPFGGGTRRCLGAALAMAEQRVVLREIARRVDLEAVDAEPERPQQRNVTTIPQHGGRVRVLMQRQP